MDNEKQINETLNNENKTRVDGRIPSDNATNSTKETVTTNENVEVLGEDTKMIRPIEKQQQSSLKVTKTKSVRFLDEPRISLQVVNEKTVPDKNETMGETIVRSGRERICEILNKTIRICDKDVGFDGGIMCDGTTSGKSTTTSNDKMEEIKVTDEENNPSEKRKSSLKNTKVPNEKAKKVRFLDDEPQNNLMAQTAIMKYLQSDRELRTHICTVNEVPSFNFHEDYIVYKLAKANVSWEVISKCINRPLRECVRRWLRYLRPMALERWSREQDMELMHQVQTHSENGVVMWNVVVDNVNVNVDVCKRRYKYLHNRAAYFRWPSCACESCRVPKNDFVEGNDCSYVKTWSSRGLKMLTGLILAAILIWMFLSQ